MKTPPMPFTEENFIATILGKKTETRRLSAKPKCAVGDRVYLCEPTRITDVRGVQDVFVEYFWYDKNSLWHTLTQDNCEKLNKRKTGMFSKQLPRFMLKSFARFHADITSVHQENLLEITEKGAIAEGIREPVNGLYFDYLSGKYQCTSPIDSYLSEIAKLNKQSFEAVISDDPLVWVYKYDFVSD